MIKKSFLTVAVRFENVRGKHGRYTLVPKGTNMFWKQRYYFKNSKVCVRGSWGWEYGQFGKVQIPSTHVKMQAWCCASIIGALGREIDPGGLCLTI